MAVVSNGPSLLDVSGYWERVVVSAIVLVAVLTDLLRLPRMKNSLTMGEEPSPLPLKN